MRLRRCARGLVVDDDDCVLLYRFAIPDDGSLVWVPPGGGLEPGETSLSALRRELDEEIGLRLEADPPLVWRQRVQSPELFADWDGVANDFYLIRTGRFDPSGSLSRNELAAELVDHFVWWSSEALLAYAGTDLFSPRELPRLFADLLRAGPPVAPLSLGW